MKTLLTVAFLAILRISACAEDRPPVEAVPIAEASTTVSPKGSAYPGKRWMTRSFKITNTSERDFFVTGGSLDHVFLQVFTLDPTSGEWKSRGMFYFGFGARQCLVKPGSAFTASISLPIELSNRSILIELKKDNP